METLAKLQEFLQELYYNFARKTEMYDPTKNIKKSILKIYEILKKVLTSLLKYTIIALVNSKKEAL